MGSLFVCMAATRLLFVCHGRPIAKMNKQRRLHKAKREQGYTKLFVPWNNTLPTTREREGGVCTRSEAGKRQFTTHEHEAPFQTRSLFVCLQQQQLQPERGRSLHKK